MGDASIRMICADAPLRGIRFDSLRGSERRAVARNASGGRRRWISVNGSMHSGSDNTHPRLPGTTSISHAGQLDDADLKELGVAVARASQAPARGDCRRVSRIGRRHPPRCARGERRQVTILFADLCGFTALSHTLDAEELSERIGRYTALVDDIVLGYGGTIDKHIGDAVMALFGAPRAHDTDALRAARAALDIHAALADPNKSSRPLTRISASPAAR